MVTNESSSRPLNVRVKITTTIPPIIGPAIVPIPPITVEDMRAHHYFPFSLNVLI
jgi:hypothetical protein